MPAGVPKDRRDYRSKTKLALDMLQGALERGHLKAGWVAADDAFGMSPSFRGGLATLGMRYVQDVPAGFTVWPPEPERTSPATKAGEAPQTQAGERAAADIAGAHRWVVGGALAGDHGGRGKLGSPQLPFQRPEGVTDQQAEARRNPLGRLPPESGRQRTPLLPVQCTG